MENRVEYDDASDIALLALGLLRDYGLLSLPISIVALVRSLGIDLRWDSSFHETLAKVSAFYWPGDRWPVIVANALEPDTRQRFALGHEIHHHLKQDGPSFCQAWGSSDEPWKERAANRFASELLMPAELLLEEIERNNQRDYLCDRFWVSRQALKVRLRELVIPDTALRYDHGYWDVPDDWRREGEDTRSYAHHLELRQRAGRRLARCG